MIYVVQPNVTIVDKVCVPGQGQFFVAAAEVG